MATYVKQTRKGTYEYGVIETRKDRRADKMVRVGECPTYDEAAKAEWNLRLSFRTA